MAESWQHDRREQCNGVLAHASWSQCLVEEKKRAFSEDASIAARGEMDELAMVFTSQETFKDVSRRF